jgi:protein-S-isoprenylcysteine O-methyltransferase Ste14
MHVEEAALLEALGEAYGSYMRRTKRLIPFLY